MVHDLVKLIFEDEGEPTQLKNEVGHIFIIDRGESWVCSDFARPAFGGAFLSSLWCIHCHHHRYGLCHSSLHTSHVRRFAGWHVRDFLRSVLEENWKMQDCSWKEGHCVEKLHRCLQRFHVNFRIRRIWFRSDGHWQKYEDAVDRTRLSEFRTVTAWKERGKQLIKENLDSAQKKESLQRLEELFLVPNEQVYAEIRDRHFSNVFGFLSAKAKELQAGYDVRHKGCRLRKNIVCCEKQVCKETVLRLFNIFISFQKRHGLSSVSDMKNFVANDLKDLKQQHKSLTVREDLSLFYRTGNVNVLYSMFPPTYLLVLYFSDIGACESILSKTKTKKDFEEQLRTEHSADTLDTFEMLACSSRFSIWKIRRPEFTATQTFNFPGLLEGVDSRENLTYLEELINRQYEPKNILRLICLMSLTQGGLSSQTYNFLKQQFLQVRGRTILAKSVRYADACLFSENFLSTLSHLFFARGSPHCSLCAITIGVCVCAPLPLTCYCWRNPFPGWGSNTRLDPTTGGLDLRACKA